jgi:ring-1,2-phenylacetyl-CoA epoxidase subunit PaaD
MVTVSDRPLDRVRQAIAAIPDPEIPNVSIVDLGIVRSVEERDGEVLVTVTPTYSGCPAMQLIENAIGEAVRANGVDHFRIVKNLSPAWTTEWISETGKQKLLEAGIAPPGAISRSTNVVFEFAPHNVQCPTCGSNETKVTSEFGSTSCKAYYHCNECSSTFEYFKPL